MKTLLKLEGLALVAVLVVGYVFAKKIKKEAANVASHLNPANPDNYVNQAATGLFQAVTGSTDTIGGAAYEVSHDSQGRNVFGEAVNVFDWFGVSPSTSNYTGKPKWVPVNPYDPEQNPLQAESGINFGLF
jgi:hypothetical protein